MSDESYTLRRSGQAPLTFTGELLAAVDSERQNGRDQNRWHELRVYRTAGGKFVLQICYRSQWQGEGNHDAAEVLDRADAVAATLLAYHPTAHVAGFPAGDAYAEKQARLLRDLADRYGAIVSELLDADPAFAEKVE